VEGGSLAAVLRDPAGRGTVRRPREELVFHFPHYDLGNGGPATALIMGDYKLVCSYEKGALRLFDLSADPAERQDLAAKQPERVAAMEARLDAYLRDVKAQMAVPNPRYDPANATDPSASGGAERKAKGAGKGGRKP
jgi:hypothetical protein